MVLTFLLASLTGCDDTRFGSGGGTVDATGYEGVVQVFDAHCIACHGAGLQSGGLDLEADPCATTVGVTSPSYGAPLVDPGNAQGSVLYAKMADLGTYGGVMPTSGALSADLLAVVGDWIDAGASCDAGSGDGGASDGGSSDSGSSDSGSSDSGGDGGATDGDYGFQSVQEQVFDAACVSCHFYDSGFGDSLILTSPAYDAVVDQASSTYPDEVFVVPGDPEGSFLYQKVRGTHSADQGALMPLYADALDTAQLTLLYGWILEGAPR
jgi:hypothetical protein